MIQRNDIVLVGDCDIHATTDICIGAVIGKPFRKYLDGTKEQLEKTIVAKGVYIGYYTIIGNGSIISSNAIIDDYCLIESRVKIGESSLITYKSQICNDAVIGNGCVIGGLIGERTRVGNNCRIFGKIVHSQHNPCLGWDDDNSMEDSSIIEDYSFIGFNSTIVGGIRIGRKTYICSGAIVTKDVPDSHVVSGINKIEHFSKWKGRLKTSNFFTDHNE